MSRIRSTIKFRGRSLPKLTLATLLYFLFLTAQAQDHNDHHETPGAGDSLCFRNCFLGAHWEAHTRTFFMSTINEGALKDDYALASGAGIGLLTKPLYGFQAGVSGFFMYNLFSSDLAKPDPILGSGNRYETGLFDIQDPHNRNDLDRLEELYLRYNYSKSSLTFGKMILNTPFINSQDSRMRPTVEEGFWLSVAEWKRVGFSGGWISGISPRSTVKWFALHRSVGIYSEGVNKEGASSAYFNKIEGSSGLAMLNLSVQPATQLTVNVWNAYFENVTNTAMVELNTTQAKEKITWYQGLMFVHQDAVNHGGNADQHHTYMDEGAQSNVISLQLGAKAKKFNTSVNYTHITGDGRYLMPREWGKEQFYTVMQRERIEGFGNAHAFLLKSTYSPGLNVAATLGYGYTSLPDVKNYRLNKYGLPSYHQINFSTSYAFQHFLKGMHLRFLAVYKIKQGETYDDLRYVYNKVNMVNLNIIADFKI